MSREKENKFAKEVKKVRDISNLPKEEQAAILARREYYRKWRKANADKVREHNRRYWLKKAQKQKNA